MQEATLSVHVYHDNGWILWFLTDVVLIHPATDMEHGISLKTIVLKIVFKLHAPVQIVVEFALLPFAFIGHCLQRRQLVHFPCYFS